MNADRRELDMTQGVIWKQILKFFFPLWYGMLFQTLYSVADALIVGRLIGSDALAAVGNTGAVIALFVGLFSGLASGVTVLSAQYRGSGEYSAIRRVTGTGLTLSLITGLVLTVLSWVLAPALIHSIDTPAEIVRDSVDYMKLYALGMAAMSVYNIGAGILRGLGDSRRPVIALAVSGIVNIVLDLALVTVIPMGVKGVALATSISQVVSAVLILRYLAKNATVSLGAFQRKDFRIEAKMARRIAGISIPAAVLSSTYNVTNLLIQAGVNGFGTACVAAWSVYGKADVLFWLTLSAMSSALTTFAGQNYGAGNDRRMRQGLHTTLGIMMGVFVVCSAALLVFCRPLFSIFTNDEEVLSIGWRMVVTLAPWYFLFVAEELYSATVRSSGDSVWPMIINLSTTCVVRLGWILALLPRWHTIEFLCWSYPVSWFAGAVGFLLYYRWGGWEKRGLRHSMDG